MFSKAAEPASPSSDPPRGRGDTNRSILAADLAITGEVVSAGEVEVLGVVDGNVTADRLTIGRGGRISGSVRAGSVEVLGQLDGKVESSSFVVRTTAQVTADIGYSDLTIESGARIEGRLTRPQG